MLVTEVVAIRESRIATIASPSEFSPQCATRLLRSAVFVPHRATATGNPSATRLGDVCWVSCFAQNLLPSFPVRTPPSSPRRVSDLRPWLLFLATRSREIVCCDFSKRVFLETSSEPAQWTDQTAEEPQSTIRNQQSKNPKPLRLAAQAGSKN